MRLDAIENSNDLEPLSKQSGLTLGYLYTFINSQNIPDLIVSGESVPNVIKSSDSSQDDLQDKNEEE